MLTKQETLSRKGCLGGEEEDKGSQENRSAMRLEVLGFMVMGLVSELSLANHSDSRSLLVVCVQCSVKTDSNEKDSGRLAGHMDRSLLTPLTFLKLFWLMVAC